MFENLACVLASGENTNFGTCIRNLKNAKALLFTPTGYKIPVSGLPTFIATINTKLRVDSKITRAQYIKDIKGVEKANIANSTQTWGDGTTIDTRDERVGRVYQFENLCAFEGLSTYNGQYDAFDVWMILADGVVIGARTTIDATGEAAVMGFDLARIFTSQYDEVINDTQAMFTLAIELADASEWRRMVAFMPSDGSALKSLSGLQTVNLERAVQSAPVVGEQFIRAATSCGGVNMGDVFPTELLDETLWKVYNDVTGVTIPVDAVTYDSVRKLFKLVFDDASYTVATRLRVTLAAPSVLSGADIEWYEADTISFPK